MNAERTSAALIALLVLGALILRTWLYMDENGVTVSQAIWALARFYTIWVNALIGVAALRVALDGRVSASNQSHLLLSIVIVAVVYHTLLARLNDFSGLDWVADHLLHTVIPVGFAVFWAVFVPKSDLGWGHLPIWLILPFVYCLYAMARGALDGVYPYFFLDLATLGPARTALNVLGLLVAFTGIGAALVGIARVLPAPRLS